MFTRLVSAILLFFLAIVTIVSSFSPDSPLFLFVSNQKWVAVGRAFLVAAMLFISLKQVITRPGARLALGIAGICLMAFGFISFFVSPIQGAMYNMLKPLDLLLIIEAGVIFSSTSLSSVESDNENRQLQLPMT